ncbi:hypothetical protein ABT147_20250 [Streptomyces sp. NPDC001868]|uniref:hypothetical protein n=1 Tax=Streptomyces sp. NPDC001868 TaxID=3154401 RepID=UPI0033301042
MRSHLQWSHGRGERVVVEPKQAYRAILLKFLVLVGLLYMPALLFHWGAWIPFAGAGVYLLWELGRVNSALGELADLWNEQYERREEPARSEPLGR